MNDDLIQAATLTFAMLRFEQEAAHARHGSSEDKSRPGIDEFIFAPSWRPTPRAEVVSFLAGLSSPALLYPTTWRGSVVLILVDELSGERRAWAQKTLDNQLAGINELAAQFFPPLEGESKVLLEVRDESHVVSLDVLRFWSQRFSCPVGWNIGGPRPGAEGVAAQIRLFSSDGRVSPPSIAVAPWDRPGW